MCYSDLHGNVNWCLFLSLSIICFDPSTPNLISKTLASMGALVDLLGYLLLKCVYVIFFRRIFATENIGNISHFMVLIIIVSFDAQGGGHPCRYNAIRACDVFAPM